MADPILPELNLTTVEEVWPRVIEDNFFLDTPFQAYMRDHAMTPFRGGAFMKSVFRYAPLIGGAYAQGDTFNIEKQRTLAGTLFDPKKYEVSVPEYLEELEIQNKGDEAVFSLVDADLENAMDTISAIVAIDLSLHGQVSGGGVVGSRPKNINGWIEAINDGITPGWDGSIFTSYGTQARNGVITSALNGNVIWLGNPDGSTGPVTYQAMEEAYQTCSIGRQEPDLIVSNKAFYAFVKERMQTAQRFAQERDPIWGVSGMRFNSAMFLKDDYFPSAKFGKNDAFLGNYKTGTFTSPATVGANSNMPTSKTCTVGEVCVMFNTRKFALRLSDSALFGFGWTGFKPAQDSTRVVGQTLASLNLQCFGPRYNAQLIGIGS